MIDTDNLPLGALVVALLIIGGAAMMPLAPTNPTPAKEGTVQTPDPVRAPGDVGDLYRVPSSHVTPDDEAAQTPDPSSVRASAGAQSMQVDVRDRGGDVELVLEDDTVHDGRWVAVPTTWFRDAVGYVPAMAHVSHESGDSYSATVRTRGGQAVFWVEEFSTNTVTFESSVSIQAQPAADGSQFTYNVSDADAVSNLEVNVTGHTATEWDNETGSSISASGGTGSIAVGGNMEPVGPGGGEPEVSITGHGAKHYDSTNSSATLAFGAGKTVELVFNDPPDTITAGMVPVGWTSNDAADNAYLWTDIYIAHGDTTGQDGIQGTKVAGDVSTQYPDDITYSYSEGFDASADDKVTVTVDVTSYNLQYEIQVANADMSLTAQPPTNVTVDTDTGQTADLGSDDVGRLDIQPDTTQLTFTAADGAGNLDYTVNMQERQATADPAVEVNGQTFSHTGTLADGETTTLTTDATIINQGDNTVNVSTDSVSTDAPDPVVDLDYQHDASSNKSVSYSAEKWSERYDFNKTYPSARENATVTIPFDGPVIGMRDLTLSINGSETPPVSSNLSASTLTVNAGDVGAGATVRVQATGSKVETLNSSITVLDPTPLGSTTETQIRLDSWTPSTSAIGVGGTADGAKIHYVSSASYTPNESVLVDSSGTQRLRLPNANDGSQVIVTVMPVEASPQTGAAELSVTDADALSWRVRPGESGGDSIDYTYLDATSGEEYVLYSTTNDVVRDSAEASSPVTLTDSDDNNEVLTIDLESGTISGDSSSGGGGGAIIVSDSTAGTGSVPWIPLIGVALALAGLVIASRNDDAVASAGEGAAETVEGGLRGVPVVGPAVGRGLAGVVQSGSQFVQAALSNKTVSYALIVAVAVGAIQAKIIQLPEGSLVLLAVVGAAIGSLIALREFDEYSTERWVATVVVSAVVALQVLSDQSILTAIVESQVFPLIALGALYLAYKLVQGLNTPDEKTTIVVGGREIERGDSD